MAKQRASFRPERALFPAGYYASNSIYQGYISLYYTHLGFGGGQLGAISASSALAALLFQPLWGALGDKTKSRRRMLFLLAFSAAAALPLAAAGKGFAWQLGAAFVFYAFFCALLPLGDTMLLEAEGGRFGAYRLAGGISFALTGALFGWVRGRMHPGGVIWCAVALLGLTAAFALLLPDSPGKQRHRGDMRSLLRDQRLLALLAFLLPLQMTMGYFYTFHAPHFKEIGGSDALLGLGHLLAAAGEAPYLLFSGRIYRRFGAEKPMLVAALVLAVRWLLLGLTENAWAALFSQLLHGGGFIVITVSMAYWISENVPEERRASGQAMLNMVTFGAARIAGNLLGGALAGAAGMDMGFAACAALCFTAAGFFFLYIGRQQVDKE